MSEPRRMQITGLHHLTLICSDMERTIAFYRDLLGLAVVRDGVSDDDPGTRHVWFGAADGAPGRLLSAMEYPQMAAGSQGVGLTHHFALAVDSAEELDAWRDYLRGKSSRSRRGLSARPRRNPGSAYLAQLRVEIPANGSAKGSTTA
jgi:glyoxylase I family protein